MRSLRGWPWHLGALAYRVGKQLGPGEKENIPPDHDRDSSGRGEGEACVDLADLHPHQATGPWMMSEEEATTPEPLDRNTVEVPIKETGFRCGDCEVRWFVIRPPRTQVEACPFCGSQNTRMSEESESEPYHRRGPG